MAHEVFISYSNKDAAVAEAVCTELEAKGIQCWMAPRNIVSGTKYSQSIINGITESQLMVVVYSSHANESDHVVAEIDRAYNKRIPIIPFRIEDVPLSPDLEYYLSTSQWLDAFDGQTKPHLERLVETVRLLLKKTGSLPKPAPMPQPKPRGNPGTVAAGSSMVTPAKSSRAPWLIAGLMAVVAFVLVGVLIIALIVFAIQKTHSNASLANGNNTAVPSPATTNPSARETIQRRPDAVETELMRRARKAILDAEISGDTKALNGLLRQDFRTRRPNDQILSKEQLISEVDSGLFEGLQVSDRSKVSVTVDDPRAAGSGGLMSLIRISYLDQGRTMTEVRRDMTIFVKENDRLVAIGNRWTKE
jgi:hypothetical protein